MRITQGQLRQIIKEELSRALSLHESPVMRDPRIRARRSRPLTSVRLENFPAELESRRQTPLYKSVVAKAASRATEQMDEYQINLDELRGIIDGGISSEVGGQGDQIMIGDYGDVLTFEALGTSDSEYGQLMGDRNNPDPRYDLMNAAIETFLDDVVALVAESSPIRYETDPGDLRSFNMAAILAAGRQGIEDRAKIPPTTYHYFDAPKYK